MALFLPLVPAKIQKGPDNTKARKGTTVTLTAEIMGEPAPDVGWTKDGEDIDEDDRCGGREGLAARTAPGAGAWAGRGPETGGSGMGAGNLGGEEQSWINSPTRARVN